MSGEFELIAKYFTRPAPPGVLGVGDDCALLTIPPQHELATSTDLLVEGRHFLVDTDPEALGHKALAVNLSDLAAMGARPLGCLLGLALPTPREDWLAAFAHGFHSLAQKSACPLIGGDTTGTAGPLTISVTVLGAAPAGQALRRASAQPNDDIWVTGTLGGPDIALRLLQGQLPSNPSLLRATRSSLERPEPPYDFAPHLIGIAHAALDISDGLVQDLGHILKASACGAVVHAPALPCHPALRGSDPQLVQAAALSGGDVYQLCFTAPSLHRNRIQDLAQQHGIQASRVGIIVAEPGLRILDAKGQPIVLNRGGYDHFPKS